MSRRVGTVFALFVAAVVLSAGPARASKPYEREQHTTESLGPARTLEVQNLLGSVEIRPSVETQEVRVTFRVVAEGKQPELAEKLGESVQLVTERSDAGLVFRVVYPDIHSRFQMPRSETGNFVSRFWGKLFDKSSVTVPYGDRNVEVGAGKDAAAVAAFIKIDVPIDAACKVEQLAGNVSVHDWRGDVDLSIVEGQITVERLYGSVRARSTGGGVAVREIKGESVELRTGSGDAELEQIQASRVDVQSSSGTIEVLGLEADVAKVRSGSGEVHFKNVEPAQLEVASDSGALVLDSLLEKMQNATIEAPDSDVTLRLGPASYDLRADTHNGAVETRAVDLERIGHEGRAAHLRHGDEGGVDLRVVARKLVLTTQDVRWIQKFKKRERMH